MGVHTSYSTPPLRKLFGKFFSRIRQDFSERWMVMGHAKNIFDGSLIIHDGDQLMDEFRCLGSDDVTRQ